MTIAVRALLDTFDGLSESERREAAAEILRRVTASDGDLTEEALVDAADALFRALDAEEAADARP